MLMRYTQRTLTLILALAVLPLGLMGCDSGGSTGGGLDLPRNADADKILQQEAGSVISATYSDLESKAQTLQKEVKELQSNTTSQNLKDAQQAWRDTRAPWEASESFLFGPVANAGLDPALDSWPVDETTINGFLGGGVDLTDKSKVEGFNTTAKGFHTIEFFLFGRNGNQSASDLSDRELQYLVTATEVLYGDTEELANAWKDGAQYRSDFVAGSGPFSSKKASLEQLAEGMDIIADEVGSGKIGTPLNEQSIKSIESKYSENSFVDYKNNMKSLKRIYTGDANGTTGQGLDEIVKEVDSEADKTLTTQINDAISKLESLDNKGSFRQAVNDGKTSDVQAAQSKILEIRKTIRDEIKPALSNL